MKLRFALLLFWVLIGLFEFPVRIWFWWSWLFNPERSLDIALGYDRLGNVAMGQGNETISSWAGRHNSWMEPIINKMFEWIGSGPDHCDKSKEKQ